jgi:hypothetical protein
VAALGQQPASAEPAAADADAVDWRGSRRGLHDAPAGRQQSHVGHRRAASGRLHVQRRQLATRSSRQRAGRGSAAPAPAGRIVAPVM